MDMMHKTKRFPNGSSGSAVPASLKDQIHFLKMAKSMYISQTTNNNSNNQETEKPGNEKVSEDSGINNSDFANHNGSGIHTQSNLSRLGGINESTIGTNRQRFLGSNISFSQQNPSRFEEPSRMLLNKKHKLINTNIKENLPSKINSRKQMHTNDKHPMYRSKISLPNQSISNHQTYNSHRVHNTENLSDSHQTLIPENKDDTVSTSSQDYSLRKELTQNSLTPNISISKSNATSTALYHHNQKVINSEKKNSLSIDAEKLNPPNVPKSMTQKKKGRPPKVRPVEMDSRSNNSFTSSTIDNRDTPFENHNGSSKGGTNNTGSSRKSLHDKSTFNTFNDTLVDSVPTTRIPASDSTSNNSSLHYNSKDSTAYTSRHTSKRKDKHKHKPAHKKAFMTPSHAYPLRNVSHNHGSIKKISDRVANLHLTPSNTTLYPHKNNNAWDKVDLETEKDYEEAESYSDCHTDNLNDLSGKGNDSKYTLKKTNSHLHNHPENNKFNQINTSSSNTSHGKHLEPLSFDKNVLFQVMKKAQNNLKNGVTCAPIYAHENQRGATLGIFELIPNTQYGPHINDNGFLCFLVTQCESGMLKFDSGMREGNPVICKIGMQIIIAPDDFFGFRNDSTKQSSTLLVICCSSLNGFHPSEHTESIHEIIENIEGNTKSQFNRGKIATPVHPQNSILHQRKKQPVGAGA